MWPYPTPRDHVFEQTWIYTTILVSYFCMCCIVYNSWNCLLQIWAHWTCGLTNNPWTRLLLSLVLLIILWFSRGNISKWKDFNNFFLYNSTQTISVLLDLTLKAQSFFFLNKVYILQYGSIISRLYFLPGRVLWKHILKLLRK